MSISIEGKRSTVDELRRSRFSRYLLELVLQVDASDGAVIGLEGAWGSGKTWVLRQLQELSSLKNREDAPIFIEFNPWMLTGADDLVAALLAEFNAQLRSDSEKGGGILAKVVPAIADYAEAFTASKHLAPAFNILLPGLGSAIEAVSATSDDIRALFHSALPVAKRFGEKSRSLQQLRKDVDKAIKEQGHRIIVVIDDLDRLPPKEAATMIQAVKAVANFPNTLYILAYDRPTLCGALESSLGIPSGHSYLEKIIQVPVSVPDLPAHLVQTWAKSKLEGAIGAPLLAEAEQADLVTALPIAAGLLQTPRDVLRLETRLRLVVPQVLGTVNIADVLVAEALALKVPCFLAWLKKHSHGLVEAEPRVGADPYLRGLLGSGESYSCSEEEEKARRHAAAVTAIEELQQSISDRQLLLTTRMATEFIFPALDFGDEWEPAVPRTQFRRISSFRFLHRWQCLVDHHDRFDLTDLEDWVLHPIGKFYQRMSDLEDFAHACDLIEVLLPHNLPAPGRGWTQLFAETEKLHGQRFLQIGPENIIAPLKAYEAGLRAMSADQREIETTVQEWGRFSLATSARLLRIALADKGLLDGGKAEPLSHQLIANAALLDELKTDWISRFRAQQSATHQARDTNALTYELSLLARNFGLPPDELRQHAIDALSRNPKLIREFLSSLSDERVSRWFGIEVAWDLLPEPAFMSQCIEKESLLLESHRKFVAALRSQLTQAAGLDGQVK